VDDLAPARLFSAFGAQSGEIHRKTEQAVWAFALAFFLSKRRSCFRSPNAARMGRGQTDLFDFGVGVPPFCFFATKETAFITLGTMAIAVLRLAVAQNLSGRRLANRSRRIGKDGFNVGHFRRNSATTRICC
jgi:hypothetical protein